MPTHYSSSVLKISFNYKHLAFISSVQASDVVASRGDIDPEFARKVAPSLSFRVVEPSCCRKPSASFAVVYTPLNHRLSLDFTAHLAEVTRYDEFDHSGTRTFCLDHLTHHGHALFAFDLFPANVVHVSLSFTRQTRSWLEANAKIAYSAQDLLANAPNRCL
jgi:hypothetical protein